MYRQHVCVPVLVLLVGLLSTPSHGQPGAGAGDSAVDEYGDPLPPGAVRRFGTVRWRTGLPVEELAWSKDERFIVGHTQEGLFTWEAKSGRLLHHKRNLYLSGQHGISPNSQWLAAIEVIKRERNRLQNWHHARIIDLASGQTLASIKPDEADSTNRGPRSMAWFADGAKLALGYDNGHIDLVDTGQWKVIGRLSVPSKPTGSRRPSPPVAGVYRLAISPDGKTLVAQYGPVRVRFGVWDVANQTLRHLDPRTYDLECNAIRIAADNRTLHVAFHRIKRGRPYYVKTDVGPAADLKGPALFALNSASVSEDERVAFSGDARFAAEASANSSRMRAGKQETVVQVTDMASGESTAIGPKRRGLPAMAFSGDGRALATAGRDQTVRLWNVETGRPRSEPKGHTGPILSLAVSPDGRHLATGSSDNTIRVREVATGKTVQVFQGEMNGVLGLGYLPDGKSLVSLSRGEALRTGLSTFVHIWDIGGGRRDGFCDLWRARGPIVAGPNGERVGFTHGGVTVVVDTAAFKLVEPPHGDDTSTMAGTLRFYADVPTGSSNPVGPSRLPTLVEKPERNMDQRMLAWYCGAFSPDGKRMVLGKEDMLSLHDSVSGERLRKLAPISDLAPQEEVPHFRHVAFTPNGEQIIAVRDVGRYPFRVGSSIYGQQVGDQIIQVWDANTGAVVRSMRGHRGAINDLAFAENGRLLFTAGADGTVLQWDLHAAPPVAALPGDVDGLASMLWGDESGAAVQAMQVLASKPEKAEAVVGGWLAQAPEHEAATALINRLSHDDLRVRLSSIGQLRQMQKDEPAVEGLLLRHLLEDQTPVEVQLRLRNLLEAYGDGGTATFVRLSRVIKLSEWVADAAARARLTRMADRLPGRRGGDAARAALDRIAAGTNRAEYDALPPPPTDPSPSRR